MKKTIIIASLIFILTVFQFAGKAENKSKRSNKFLQINGSYIMFSDSDFKNTYTENAFYPEIKLGIFLGRKLFLWGTFGFLSSNGYLEEIDEDTKANQIYARAGLGYKGNISKKLAFSLEAGAFFAKYKEEAMEEEISDSAISFSLGLNLIFNISKSFYTELGASYMTANDSIENKSFKIGGINSFIGLGFRF